MEITAIYQHLGTINVTVGQNVTNDTVIGNLGPKNLYDKCVNDGYFICFELVKGDTLKVDKTTTINPHTLINF